MTPVSRRGASAPASHPRLIEFWARSMGSPLRLGVVVYPARTGDLERADAAWLAVREEFRATDQAMSRFSDTSDVTRLNRSVGAPEPVALPSRLRQALATSERARRLTEGRFDPRVLVDLERLGDRGAPVTKGN